MEVLARLESRVFSPIFCRRGEMTKEPTLPTTNTSAAWKKYHEGLVINFFVSLTSRTHEQSQGIKHKLRQTVVSSTNPTGNHTYYRHQRYVVNATNQEIVLKCPEDRFPSHHTHANPPKTRVHCAYSCRPTLCPSGRLGEP